MLPAKFPLKNRLGKGAEFNVFRKRELYSGRDFLQTRGDVVKVSISNSPKAARHIFYQLKIISELFPDNCVRVHAASASADAAHINVQEVPLHRELREINSAQRSLDILLSDNSPDPKGKREKAMRSLAEKIRVLSIAADAKMQRHANAIVKVTDRMLNIGINPSIENSRNVSLHDPKKPVFLEPRIQNSGRLRQHIETARMAPEKRKRLLSFLTRWENATY